MIFAVAACAGCGWSASSTSGLDSLLRFDGAQARGGSVTDPPSEISATVAPSLRNSAFPGASNKGIKGVVGPHANAAAIGVPGDDGYWIVPALTPDSVDPEAYDFTTQFSLSPALAQSPLVTHDPSTGAASVTLAFRAVDEDGHFGAPTTLPVALRDEIPTGTLVVSLVWDSPVDLDLHVLVPADNADGFVEVWSKKPAADPAAQDGLLDFDSNAACQIDNRDRENVIWTKVPPSGPYVVRVEAFSLCGLDAAAWNAFAYQDGDPTAIVGQASGVLTDAATRAAHGQGAGITAFIFTYP